MKLITLNTWGGRVHKKLIKFLEENQEVDIFCFQEIYNGAKTEKAIRKTEKTAQEVMMCFGVV
jgi:exonuclease III